LTQFTQELRELLGNQLLAVVLYGSAAGENFVPGSSDLNIAIVVQRMEFAVLKKLQPHMALWHKRGFAVPLIVDHNFLNHSRDVFPMEYSDIKEQHRTLWGEEIFNTLPIGGEHLRFLAEHEVRSRLLRLQALYLERAGEPPRLRQILLDSLKTFLTLMRHLLRLQGKSGVQNYAEVLSLFEQHFQVAFPEMHRLIAIRQGLRDWPHEPATEFFREYLEDVQRLVALIDGLPH
jgi:predicted nucleotidyltransferase